MTTNTLGEQLLTFGEASRYVADRFPGRRSGKPLSVSTLHRWCNRGLGDVKLQYLCAGGVRALTITAIEEFFAELTRRQRGDVDAPITPASRERRVAAAEKLLEQAGI